MEADNFPHNLVVIGNAEPTSDHSAFIDQCSVVVRFNFTPYFETGKTGTKTTILCLFGVPYPAHGEIPKLNSSIVRDCQTIWAETSLFLTPLVTGYGIAPEKIVNLCLNRMHDAYNVAGKIDPPSSGFQVLRYFVNWFPDAEKFFCGFTWVGGPRHPWEREKAQIAHYRKLGLLKSLDNICTTMHYVAQQ